MNSVFSRCFSFLNGTADYPCSTNWRLDLSISSVAMHALAIGAIAFVFAKAGSYCERLVSQWVYHSAEIWPGQEDNEEEVFRNDELDEKEEPGQIENLRQKGIEPNRMFIGYTR